MKIQTEPAALNALFIFAFASSHAFVLSACVAPASLPVPTVLLPGGRTIAPVTGVEGAVVHARHAVCAFVRTGDSARGMVAGGQGAVLVLSRNAADIRACAGHGAAYNITFAEGAALVLSRNAASFTMFASSAPEEPAVALATMSMSMFSCFTFFK